MEIYKELKLLLKNPGRRGKRTTTRLCLDYPVKIKGIMDENVVTGIVRVDFNRNKVSTVSTMPDHLFPKYEEFTEEEFIREARIKIMERSLRR